jgi:hypothetical protein
VSANEANEHAAGRDPGDAQALGLDPVGDASEVRLGDAETGADLGRRQPVAVAGRGRVLLVEKEFPASQLLLR